MKKLLIALALPLWVIQAHGQTFTTYGPSDPQSIDAGYFSDYSANGTIVLAGGIVTLTNGATYEHGNLSFQNSGTWNSQTGSLDLFAATGALTVSGITAPVFFNLQFQNAGAVSLTNTAGANITNQLAFGSSGAISTIRANHSNGAIRFADAATYTGGATDAQHVNGYVTKTGNDAFTFPVGSGTDLRVLSISAPALVTDQYSVAWIVGNPGTNGDPSNANAMHPASAVTAPIASVSGEGQWDWIPVSGTGAGLTVTVSLPAGLAAVTATTLRLVGWNGTAWVDLSGAPTASGNTEGSTISGTMISGISAIGIGSTSIALPVTFSDFTVTKQGCKALLNWTTVMEHNNDYFIVERSQDGRNFSMIGTVQAAGNSSEAQAYSFIDEQPVAGMNHYRITQVDVDGKRSSTTIKNLHFDCSNGEIKVYPTVTTGTVHVDLPGGYEQSNITVFNMRGQQVRANVAKDGLSRTVQLSTLASGTYLVRIEKNGSVETFKILYKP